MIRPRIAALMICTVVSGTAVAVLAQQPAPPRGERPPLFFRENWVETEEVPVTQAHVLNPDLQLHLYGANSQDIQVTAEGQPPHIWTGLCEAACAVTLSHTSDFVDLTGTAKIRWLTKVSGFHQIRPVVKLADGTWLVGDHTDAYNYDWHESEFYLTEIMHWLRLDMENVYTRGTWVEEPDFSRVDEIGFVDLMPGSGHGQGGWSDVAWIEVYGKRVSRAADSRD
jgi:hypothetical protein